jgi:hypothetical protein
MLEHTRTFQRISYHTHPYFYCRLLLGWGRNHSTWIDICRRMLTVKFYDIIMRNSRILCKPDKRQKAKRITGIFLQEPLIEFRFYRVVLWAEALHSPWKVKIRDLLTGDKTNVRMGHMFCSFDYPCAGLRGSVT